MNMKKYALLFFILILAVYALTACGANEVWHMGSGAPDGSASAEVGDYYLDTSADEIYRLTEGGWVRLTAEDEGTPSGGESKWHLGTAVGGEGDSIFATVEGASVGDLYLNTDSAFVYKCTSSGVWSLATRLNIDLTDVAEVKTAHTAGELGEQIITVTVFYSDGTQRVLTHTVPMALRSLVFVDSPYFRVDTAPTVRVKAIYENGDAEFINVSADMYEENAIYTAPDFTKIGSYRCAVKHGGRTATFKIEVIDLDDTSAMSITPRDNSFAIMATDASGALLTQSFTERFIATQKNGVRRELLPSELEYDFSAFSSRGTTFRVRVSLIADATVFCDMPILPIYSIDDVPYSAVSAKINADGVVAVCKDLTELPSDEGLTVTLSLTVAKNTYKTTLPITRAMLGELDGTPYVWGEHPPKPLTLTDGVLGASVDNMLLLEVFSHEKSTLTAISLKDDDFKRGVSSYSDIALNLSFKTKYGTPYTLSTDASPAYVALAPFNEQMLIRDTDINFGAEGRYPVVIHYDYDGDGKQDAPEVLTDEIFIYYRNSSNIKSVDIEDTYTIEIGDTLEDKLDELIVGKVFNARLFDNPHMNIQQVAITRAMLDTSGVPVGESGSITAAGRYEIPVRITIPNVAGEYRTAIYIEVKSDVQSDGLIFAVHLKASTTALYYSPFTEAYLYDDGTALLDPYVSPDGLMGGYAAYSTDGDILIVSCLGSRLYYALSDSAQGKGHLDATVLIPDGTPVLYTGSSSDVEWNNFDAWVYGGEYLVLVLKPDIATALNVTERELLCIKSSTLTSRKNIEIKAYGIKISFNHEQKTFVIERKG